MEPKINIVLWVFLLRINKQSPRGFAYPPLCCQPAHAPPLGSCACGCAVHACYSQKRNIFIFVQEIPNLLLHFILLS